MLGARNGSRGFEGLGFPDMAGQISCGEHQKAEMTLILGFGNPLQGDDGVGTCAVEMLNKHVLPPEVRVHDAGTPGFSLVSELEGWKRVILIDAVRMGRSPGSWRRFEPGEVRLLAADGMVSLHQPGLANALALAQALDLLPEEIIFYGIEPIGMNLFDELNPDVRDSVAEVIESIINEL